MPLKCGIVGLPNVGKSTIFKALTNVSADIANYPFCTINPNQGSIIVPDPRLFKLAEMFNPKAITPATMEITDIAGLVKGASTGEGLGNQFLGQIREVDAICHIVRCFRDSNVVHVNGRVDPVNDIEIIDTELAIKDLEVVNKACQKTIKLVQHEKQAKMEYTVYTKLKEALEKGVLIRNLALDETEMEITRALNLLTHKPVLYVANVGEEDLNGGNENVEILKAYAAKEKSLVVTICGKIECELLDLPETERDEYLKSYGMTEPGKNQMIRSAYQLLGYLTFFTGGEKEVRAWTIIDGYKAPQAAGTIHTDFERGFISAEVVHYNDLMSAGSYNDARMKGLIRLEGKEYVMKDGDVCIFRFSV